MTFKVAAECNLRCTYCYWFSDPAVLAGRPIAADNVLAKFVRRVDEYLRANPDERLTVSLHGGEPLLLGKRRFASLCDQLVATCGNRLTLACQTNGMLIDPEWISIFRHFAVRVGISLDGSLSVHDARRVGKHGEPSHRQAERGFRLLQEGGLDPGILAVWSPSASAKDVVRYFVDELGASWFDVLMLDATYDSPVPDCSRFYCELFDIWLDELTDRGVTIRICEAIARTFMALPSGMESIGHGRVTTLGVSSDGDYELLDVLNIAGSGLARTSYSIFDTTLERFLQSTPYVEQVDASRRLCATCSDCRFSSECGGGYLPARWSSVNGFDNPSAHCKSLYRIFDHCESRMRQRLALVLEHLLIDERRQGHLSPN